MKNMILNINKEPNMTSRDVVNKVSKILNIKRVGHTGTLDPLATGVLIITVGKYTKLNEDLMSMDKEYITEFRLGILTDTLDITGNVIRESHYEIDEVKLKSALKYFERDYLQEVPLYSAVKVDGMKLYQYARQNKEVTLPSKMVSIKELELISINDEIIKVRCKVSKGTYIRSLIRDIGDYLNTDATMVSLIRTKQGMFALEESITLKDLEDGNYKSLKIEDVLDVLVIDDYEEMKNIYNGVKVKYDSASKYLLFKKDGEEVALYKRDGEYFRMHIRLDT